MVPRDVSETLGSLSRFGYSALTESKASLLLFWSVFWKVTAATTVLFVLLFFSLHPDDFSGQLAEVAFAVVVVSGYCLFYAVWVGLGAGAFATAWRWCGPWIIVPVVGAVFGAVAAVAIAFLILRGIDFRGAGPHGGGDIAAFLVLGFLAVSAVIGANAGGVLSGIPALMVALTTRHRRQANTSRNNTLNPTGNRPAS